jgi:uncharacterized protein involved in exopolysaccharide biosynthesis
MKASRPLASRRPRFDGEAAVNVEQPRSRPKGPPAQAKGRFDARAQQKRIEAVFAKRPGLGRLTSAGIAGVWLLAGAYYFLMPPTYISRWTIILPTSSSSSSVNLETIGQASTTPSQPFGSVQLSPKVIYREIASSDQVRERAAASVGMPAKSFGRVRVRLIDETALMNFQITGKTPEEARAKGEALIAAFNTQLDVLRRDEMEKRARPTQESLKLYQSNVERARERIIEFQRESGLLSVNQFNEAASSVELLRRRLAERRAEHEKVAAEQKKLIARIGLPPDTAAQLLMLASNPSFARLATSFAEGEATVQENALRYGPNHPAMILAKQKRDGSIRQIENMAVSAGVGRSSEIRRLVMVVGASPQSDLLRNLVAGEVLLTGTTREISKLEGEVLRLENEVARMGVDAARLESLRKDHLVAEAVFTSAAARLDTSKADHYSSYPLVQVLAQPDLPENRTQPRLAYAIAAGLVGTLFVLLAWGAVWVRNLFSRRRSRSV